MITMRAPVTALMVLGMTFLLAGCVDDAEPKEVETDLAETTDTELGTIQGAVTTEEGLPVKGATVAIQPGDKTFITLKDGTYRFTDVAPGKYTLIAQKLGFESTATSVQVAAGETATKDVTLEAVRIVESYVSTVIHRGVLTCTFGTLVWVSPCDYPYTAAYYTLHDNGVNLTNYGLPAEPLENDWRWNTEYQPGFENAVTELHWTPVSAASEQMMIVVSCDEFDPVIDDCDGWGHLADGAAPLVRLEWKDPKDDEPIFMTRVYLPWGDTQVALDQKYDVFHSFCYGAKCDDAFSAAPTE